MRDSLKLLKELKKEERRQLLSKTIEKTSAQAIANAQNSDSNQITITKTELEAISIEEIDSLIEEILKDLN